MRLSGVRGGVTYGSATETAPNSCLTEERKNPRGMDADPRLFENMVLFSSIFLLHIWQRKPGMDTIECGDRLCPY